MIMIEPSGNYERNLKLRYKAIRARLHSPQHVRPMHSIPAKKHPDPIYSSSKPQQHHRTKFIIRAVAKKHRITVADIMGPRKFSYLFDARQEIMWRLRHRANLTFDCIGPAIGVNPSSASRGARRHEQRMNER